jgi:PAS domain S-box-containing protein
LQDLPVLAEPSTLPALVEALPCAAAILERLGAHPRAANAAWRRTAPPCPPGLAEALLSGQARFEATDPAEPDRAWDYEIAPHPDDPALALVTCHARPGGRAALLVRAFADHARDMFALSDAETARVVYVNATEAGALGYTPQEVVGRLTIPDMVPGWSLADFHALVARLEAGEAPPPFESGVRRRDGSILPVEVAVTLVRDGDARYVGAVCRDISERIAGAAAARDSEARLRTLVGMLPQIVWTADAQGRLDWHSPRWREYTGLAHGAAPEAWLAIIHPDDLDQTMAAWRAAIATGTPYETEHRLRRHDGAWRWFLSRAVALRDGDGPVSRWFGAGTDIHDLRTTEAALAASEERLARASAAARLGVWEVDPAARLGMVNAEYRALYGLPPGDAPLAHDEWLARIHPDDRARMAEASALIHRDGGEYREEYRILRADTGELRWLAAHGSAVDSPGRPRRIVGICFDVTERREEQERQMLLAREVDHRAKNVLAVVVSILKLTRADTAASFAETVQGRVAALARAHTLLSRERWTGSSLHDVVAEELAAYHGAARVAIGGPPVRLPAGAVQPVSMVLHELATNAAKYGALSLAGGHLSVTWRTAGAPSASLCIDWLERGGPPIAGPPRHRGFGTTLIDATVRGQLRGSLERHWDDAGLRCTITLPAPAPQG